MRIFLAVEIPENIKKKLVGAQEELRPLFPGVRWEKPEKLHITLVFLGEVDEERVVELEEVVRKGLKGVKGFKVGFSKVGVFPKKRPRVVLVGIGEGREQVVELQRRLAEALTSAGFDFARLSRPHVTLGRFTRQKLPHLGGRGVHLPNFDRANFEVKELVIMKSKLHPAGAIHTPIVRIPL